MTSFSLYPYFLSWALDPVLLGQRMSFIAGPRQIGKTTLLEKHLQEVGGSDFYFNWDTPAVRQAYHQNPDFFLKTGFPTTTSPSLPLIVFDEMHKYPKWKSILKGFFDAWRGKIRFVITGSARLDFMRKSGDSLVGRYFLFRKLPLHPRECFPQTGQTPAWRSRFPFMPDSPSESKPEWKEATNQLMALNGFPEPFLNGSQELLNRWRTEHLSLLVTEDLADLTKIEQILKVEELASLLRTKIGSPLSINNLSKELQVGFPTVKRWLAALELVYLTFRIPPYTRKLTRAIRKEHKLYFWDWSLVQKPAARFENVVAVYLMRAVHSWNERGLGQYKLFFVRTRDKIETDFLVVDEEKPVLLIEAKLSETDIDPSLLHFKHRLHVPEAFQIVSQSGIIKPHPEKGVWTLSLDRFLQLTP